MNALVTVLPSSSDWNRLAAIADDGRFRADRMQAHYDHVREWLPVTLPDPALAADDRVVVDFLLAAVGEVTGQAVDNAAFGSNNAATVGAALGQLLDADLNRAFLAGEPEGVFRLPQATENGERRGTREAILDTVAEGFPLEVRLGAFVTRVVWDRDVDPPRAIGVEYREGDHLYRASLGPGGTSGAAVVEFASQEIILSAGVFNSPQLLMLSGVGDPEQLALHGIDPVVERIGVGENLQDRYEASVINELSEDLSLVVDCQLGVAGDPCLDQWFSGEGLYQTNGFAATALVRSSPELAKANLQIFAFPAESRGYYPGYSTDALIEKNRFSWLILEGYTTNNDGFVELISADPFDKPRIVFNSYDEADPLRDPDLLAMVEGIGIVRRITERVRDRNPALTIEEIWPGEERLDPEDLAAFVRKESWGHHACCTNAMGRTDDPSAVVDSHFRVIGADGLRVVDASVWPEIPGTFIALPTFMLSEAAAEVILEDR